MTEREAIEVFDELRKTYRKLKPGGDVKALRTLLIGHVLTDSLGTPFSSALGALRSVLEEMDRWEHRRSFRN
jgi:hypothetical protein